MTKCIYILYTLSDSKSPLNTAGLSAFEYIIIRWLTRGSINGFNMAEIVSIIEGV
jgi:hypothetical protein